MSAIGTTIKAITIGSSGSDYDKNVLYDGGDTGYTVSSTGDCIDLPLTAVSANAKYIVVTARKGSSTCDFDLIAQIYRGGNKVRFAAYAFLALADQDLNSSGMQCLRFARDEVYYGGTRSWLAYSSNGGSTWAGTAGTIMKIVELVPKS